MEQIEMPFAVNFQQLRDFLSRITVLEDEMDRLREEVRLVREDYRNVLPLRAVSTALKVVRARRKLAAHETEPLDLPYQASVERQVAEHLDALEAKASAAAEALAQGERGGMTIEDLLQAPRDIVQQIMAQHWDLAACQCWVCVQGYRLGCRAMDSHLRYKLAPDVAAQLTDVTVAAPKEG